MTRDGSIHSCSLLSKEAQILLASSVMEKEIEEVTVGKAKETMGGRKQSSGRYAGASKCLDARGLAP